MLKHLHRILILMTAIGCPLSCGVQLCACLSGLCDKAATGCCRASDQSHAAECGCESSASECCANAGNESSYSCCPTVAQSVNEVTSAKVASSSTGDCCAMGCSTCECCSDVAHYPFDFQTNESTDVQLMIAWSRTSTLLVDAFPTFEVEEPGLTRPRYAMDDRSWLGVWLN